MRKRAVLRIHIRWFMIGLSMIGYVYRRRALTERLISCRLILWVLFGFAKAHYT
jgi:hypothetical protein